MCNENREWRTETIGDLNASIQRVVAALASIDDEMAFYRREQRSLELDVMALGEALGHAPFKPNEWSAMKESPSAMSRQYIEEVRRLTGMPEAARKVAQIDASN